MTDTERKVMVRLCSKILTETDLYEVDMSERLDRNVSICMKSRTI